MSDLNHQNDVKLWTEADEEAGAKVLRVAANSRAGSVAGAIKVAFLEGPVVLDAMGAQALSVAVKAVALARGFLAPDGVDLLCRPGFREPGAQGDVGAVRLVLVDGRRV